MIHAAPKITAPPAVLDRRVRAGDWDIGDFWAPNLTPAGLADWSDGEIVRAIREGVGRDGRSLLSVPSATFRNLSDSDVLALLAYLRTQLAMGEPSPARRCNVLGAILIATIIPDESFSAQPPLVAPVVGPRARPDSGIRRLPSQRPELPELPRIQSDRRHSRRLQRVVAPSD